MEAIADDVSGATVAIVEQVLEEYGDPGTADGDDSTGDTDGDEREESFAADSTDAESVTAVSDEAESAMSEHDSRSDARLELSLEPADVTEKQLETLEEIYDRPDATQAALADTLGVSSATISQRVNAIDGFSWSNRREFVEVLFDDGAWFEETDGTVDETDRTDSEPESDLVADGTTTEEPATDGPETDGEVALERTESNAGSDTESAESDGERTAVQTEPGGERTAVRTESGGEGTIERTEADGESTIERTEADGENTVERDEADGGDTVVRAESDGERAPKSHADGGVDARAPVRSTESDTGEMCLAASESVGELSERLEAVTQRLESLERRLADDAASSGGVLSDPELAHKVVHACLTADHISEEEELQLLKELTTADAT